MVDYNLSQATFPVKKGLAQHSDTLGSDDVLFECTLLAGKILGVRCNDTEIKDYFQITADPFSAKTPQEAKEYDAFNNFFYKNYGKHDDHCYFDSEYEAFFNLIKAWQIWKEILSDDQKVEYFTNF